MKKERDKIDTNIELEIKNSICPNEAPEGFYDADAAENSSRPWGGESGGCGT